MAPKMYFTLDVSGKATFKVKGVDTSTNNYTYNQLLELFKAGNKITFTGQTQFRNIPIQQGAGIVIKEDLIKSYVLIRSSKRT